MFPSKLLIGSYMLGGFALGSLLEPMLDHRKKGSSGAMIAGVLAIVLVLAVVNAWLYKRAIRQPDAEFPLSWWERYGTAVTASASFAVGFVLIVSAVIFR